MRLYPVFLDMRGRRALVVGDGEVAARKAEPLRASGATVIVRPGFDPSDLSGCALAIGADAPEADLTSLAAAARDAGIPVNIVDRPDLGTCMAPALIDRDPITVAISTAGTAPVLARLLRQQIEALLPPSLGRLARLADRFTTGLRRDIPDPAARRPLLEAALTGPAADLLLDGREAEAEAAFAASLGGRTPGIVHLIGAGPGEPDLLTLRAQRLLGGAEMILHDPDVGAPLLAMARRDAARQVAGPLVVDQAASLAGAGLRVVRLARGDGSTLRQEAGLLAARGVLTRLVPGIVDGRDTAATPTVQDDLAAATPHAATPHAATPRAWPR